MAAHVTLPGSSRQLLPDSRPAGPVDPSEIVSITVRVRSRGDLGQLARTALAESVKAPAERTYLSRRQLADDYGADPADLDKVEAVASRHDLRVVHRSAAERSIVLSGRLGDVLAAFPANVAIYHHANGMYRGRQGEIAVPESLDGVVTGIFGFDTRPKQRHGPRRAAPDSGPGGDRGNSPTFFATRYRFPTEHDGATLDGSDQTIAIIELGGGFRMSDLKVYFQEIGVPLPDVTSVSVDRGHNTPTGDPNSADGEVMLDIEVAGAVAPGAKIAIYFAPIEGDDGFLHAVSAALHDEERSPSVISISWGGPAELMDQQGITAFNEIFTAAMSAGVTVCAAAGDHGTADLDASRWDGDIHVDHPASDPFVLACGGTQIDDDVDVVWNDGTTFDTSVPGGGGWATGGGISTVFDVPDYQKNITMPDSLVTGEAGRGVPDIAMSATDYFTRVDSFEGRGGGTSAVAPLMAGLVALLNQAVGAKVGFLNPLLYTTRGVTHDVTAGTNAIKGKTKGYQAGKGWDACTGMGTPDGTAILEALIKPA
jgi:kumamolisin